MNSELLTKVPVSLSPPIVLLSIFLPFKGSGGRGVGTEGSVLVAYLEKDAILLVYTDLQV